MTVTEPAPTGTNRQMDSGLAQFPALPLGEIHNIVSMSVQRGADQMWSLDDLNWQALRPEALTDADRSVIRFLTFIEDHIPDYLTRLLTAFPLNAELNTEEFAVNREYFRYFVAWAYDEERHASALTRYQAAAGMAETDELLRELAVEGAKQLDVPYEHPLQVFTYTMVQEKATQLFYQRFLDVVREPVLGDLLRRLARDEARHFALYSRLVGEYIRRDQARVVPHLKDVLRTFRMPLAGTLSNYWRWSLRVADAVGYDHTEAYEALVRLVRDLVDRPGEAGVRDLGDFVQAVRRLP